MRDEQQRFQVLAALTRLRLLASHPKLYDATSTVASSKLQARCSSCSRSCAARAIARSCSASSRRTSRSSARRSTRRASRRSTSMARRRAKQRAQLIERFQGGEGDVFLISLKAGGTGINLTAADYVHPPRSVVEPRRRGSGDRPRAPHRPDQAGDGLSADRARHDRGARSSRCIATSARSSPASSRAPTSPRG